MNQVYYSQVFDLSISSCNYLLLTIILFLHQSTVKDPAKCNMYKGISAAYGIIVLSYWSLAFSGYWAFGLTVQPYILSSLTIPRWTIVMANIFAVIQISGCFQVLIPTFRQYCLVLHLLSLILIYNFNY